ncbi:hypothetical protein LC724_24205 [Blautia sp. RD014234]|nr:hypothetical protein [Blautia parvula]
MMEVSLNVPLGEQPHLKEMFAMMEENRMDAQAQNLEDFYSILTRWKSILRICRTNCCICAGS